MKKPFVPSAVPPENQKSPAYWFVFRKQELLVDMDSPAQPVPLAINVEELSIAAVRRQFFGFYDGYPCFSVEAEPEVNPIENYTFEPLRSTFFKVDDDFIMLGGRAIQIVNWDRDHQFCGRCGNRMQNSAREHAKNCPHCGLISYPRISPAVIVAVWKGREILLARSARFPLKMYSVLAGFVEAGETLEETVEREIYEEVGIHVQNIEYFGSQPWPFPDSLMIGFTAEYAGGEIRIEEEELTDAGWYAYDNLPVVSPKISIARQLIDHFVDKMTRQQDNS